MPNLEDHQSVSTTKMLFVGDSGAGKSGALASLASEGYNVRILDLDNGLDVLKNYLRKGGTGPYKPDAIKRVNFETITDPMKTVGGTLVPKSATVWQRSIGLLNDWKTSSASFGPLSTWTTQDVLVIDSLTMLCTGALNHILAMNGRLGKQPQQGDWYAAQQLIEGLLQLLYDEGVKCNVIVNCHIQYIGEENGPVHGYPASLGKALSPKIGRYFNTMLLAKTVGQGTTAKHKIVTTSTATLELKNTSPLTVKPEYDLGTGLAEYFRDVRG